LFSFGIISAVIATYQFNKGTTLWGGLSILYSVVFIVTGLLNYKNVKKWNQQKTLPPTMAIRNMDFGS